MTDREIEGLEQALNKFTKFYNELLPVPQLSAVLMAVTEGENELTYNPDLSRQDAKKILERVFGGVKQAKRQMATDMGKLHSYLTSVMISMDSAIDIDPDALGLKIKLVNKWLVELELNVDQKKSGGDLQDYFKELEEIKEELLNIAHSSEDIKTTFYRLVDSERRAIQERDELDKKLDKADAKCERIKEAFEDLKLKYNELFRKHQILMERGKADRAEVLFLSISSNANSRSKKN